MVFRPGRFSFAPDIPNHSSCILEWLMFSQAKGQSSKYIESGGNSIKSCIRRGNERAEHFAWKCYACGWCSALSHHVLERIIWKCVIESQSSHFPNNKPHIEERQFCWLEHLGSEVILSWSSLFLIAEIGTLDSLSLGAWFQCVTLQDIVALCPHTP